MTLDLGSAPRGDPRIPHVNENFFNICFFGTQASHLILWTRGRVAVTELRPRKYDRDLILQTCKENKQLRQLTQNKMPTQRLQAPNKKAGEKSGWMGLWQEQVKHASWAKRRAGPAY